MQNMAITCCFVTYCKQRQRNEQRIIKAETHDVTNRCDTSRQQVADAYTRCDKAACAYFIARYVARIQTSLNSCDRSQQQNSVGATMIFTCHTRRFVAATCRGGVTSDLSQRVSALTQAYTTIALPDVVVKFAQLNFLKQTKQPNEHKTYECPAEQKDG